MKIAIISTILLAVYIILDLIYDTQLWNANTDLTVYLQGHQFNGEQVIFQFFSLSLFVIPAIAALMFLFSDQKLGALLYGSLIVFTTALNSLLKNIYHQPRPFMSVQSIYPLECSKEYGKPSGHAMGSLIMCFMLPAILFPGIYRTTTTNKQYPVYLRILVITGLSIWVFMTGLSRVFLGVHSFGQILLGWVFSTYIAVIYVVYIHDHLFNYITQCLRPEGLGISNKIVVGVSVFIIFWISVSILFLELNINYFVTSQQINEWLLAVQVKCPLDTKIDGKNATVLYNVCFYQTMIIGFILGLVMGVHYSAGRYEEGKFSLNYINLSLKQKCIRFLLFLSLGFVIAPFFIIQFFTQKNVYISSFVSFFPTCFMGGFGIVYIFTRLLIYAQLNLKGDLLFVENQELNHSHIKQFLLNINNRSSKDMDLQMVEIVH